MQVLFLWSQTTSLISKKGRLNIKGIQSPGQTTAWTKWDWNMESEEKGWSFTYCTRECYFLVIPDFEKEMVTSTSSGWSKEKRGSPSLETRSGRMRTMWQPLSMREGFRTGKITVGPVREALSEDTTIQLPLLLSFLPLPPPPTVPDTSLHTNDWTPDSC